jgi:hypothetical protein
MVTRKMAKLAIDDLSSAVKLDLFRNPGDMAGHQPPGMYENAVWSGW